MIALAMVALVAIGSDSLQPAESPFYLSAESPFYLQSRMNIINCIYRDPPSAKQREWGIGGKHHRPVEKTGA